MLARASVCLNVNLVKLPFEQIIDDALQHELPAHHNTVLRLPQDNRVLYAGAQTQVCASVRDSSPCAEEWPGACTN